MHTDVKDEADASHVAARIQAQLKEPIVLAGEEVFTSASIGIALSETGYERAEDILRWYREFMGNAPEEMGGFVGFHLAPPLPFLPDEVN